MLDAGMKVFWEKPSCEWHWSWTSEWRQSWVFLKLPLEGQSCPISQICGPASFPAAVVCILGLNYLPRLFLGIYISSLTSHCSAARSNPNNYLLLFLYMLSTMGKICGLTKLQILETESQNMIVSRIPWTLNRAMCKVTSFEDSSHRHFWLLMLVFLFFSYHSCLCWVLTEENTMWSNTDGKPLWLREKTGQG
jgi:hypothetical protein